jgi:hypothetical protein
MEIFEQSESGIIYQLLVPTQSVGSVIVDLTYSDFVSNNELVEAVVEPADNPGLTPYNIAEVNIELEKGLYLEIAEFLAEQYAATGINYTYNY